MRVFSIVADVDGCLSYPERVEDIDEADSAILSTTYCAKSPLIATCVGVVACSSISRTFDCDLGFVVFELMLKGL